jgi:predicted DNA-binding protein YlxM (UPF0122 family)
MTRKKIIVYKGESLSIQDIADKSGYSNSHTKKMIRDGVSVEEVLSRQKHLKIKDNRKVPLFHFRSLKELQEHLGLSRQRIYQRVSAGHKLTKTGDKIHFL